MHNVLSFRYPVLMLKCVPLHPVLNRSRYAYWEVSFCTDSPVSPTETFLLSLITIVFLFMPSSKSTKYGYQRIISLLLTSTAMRQRFLAPYLRRTMEVLSKETKREKKKVMKNNYNLFISHKRINLSTANCWSCIDMELPESSFGVPLVVLWLSYRTLAWIRSAFEQGSKFMWKCPLHKANFDAPRPSICACNI